jgi:hypothetical protein
VAKTAGAQDAKVYVRKTGTATITAKVTATVDGKATTKSYKLLVTVVDSVATAKANAEEFVTLSSTGTTALGAISRSKATMELWSTLPLSLNKLPEGATVTWLTSNKSIATVTATTGSAATVYVKKAGTATITALVTYTASGKTQTLSFSTKVTAADANKGKKVTAGISRKTATMEIYSTLPVSIVGLPAGGTVTWTTSDKTVATVTKTKGKQDAKVYVKKAGTATITAKVTTKANGKTTTKTYTVKVTVTDANAKAKAAATEQAPTVAIDADRRGEYGL